MGHGTASAPLDTGPVSGYGTCFRRYDGWGVAPTQVRRGRGGTTPGRPWVPAFAGTTVGGRPYAEVRRGRGGTTPGRRSGLKWQRGRRDQLVVSRVGYQAKHLQRCGSQQVLPLFSEYYPAGDLSIVNAQHGITDRQQHLTAIAKRKSEMFLGVHAASAQHGVRQHGVGSARLHQGIDPLGRPTIAVIHTHMGLERSHAAKTNTRTWIVKGMWSG